MKQTVNKVVEAVIGLGLSNSVYTAPPPNWEIDHYLIDGFRFIEGGTKDRFITTLVFDIHAITATNKDIYSVKDSLDMQNELTLAMKPNRDSTLDLGSAFNMTLMRVEDTLQTINQTERYTRVVQTTTYYSEIEQI